VFVSFQFSANALMMNDDCQTPLEVARAKGYGNVVRAIEVCLTVHAVMLKLLCNWATWENNFC